MTKKLGNRKALGLGGLFLLALAALAFAMYVITSEADETYRDPEGIIDMREDADAVILLEDEDPQTGGEDDE